MLLLYVCVLCDVAIWWSKEQKLYKKKPQEMSPPLFLNRYIYIDIQKSYGPTPFGIEKVTILLSYSNYKDKIIYILISSTQFFSIVLLSFKYIYYLYRDLLHIPVFTRPLIVNMESRNYFFEWVPTCQWRSRPRQRRGARTWTWCSQPRQFLCFKMS